PRAPPRYVSFAAAIRSPHREQRAGVTCEFRVTRNPGQAVPPGLRPSPAALPSCAVPAEVITAHQARSAKKIGTERAWFLPSPPPPAPRHTTWLTQPCCWGDMAGPTMQKALDAAVTDVASVCCAGSGWCIGNRRVTVARWLPMSA